LSVYDEAFGRCLDGHKSLLSWVWGQPHRCDRLAVEYLSAVTAITSPPSPHGHVATHGPPTHSTGGLGPGTPSGSNPCCPGTWISMPRSRWYTPGL
jgi:hypothetical protein